MQFSDLNEEQTAVLEYERGFLPAVLAARFPECSSSGEISDDLSVVQLVLENGPYTDEPSDELVALGASFGDLLAQTLDLHWVVCTDDDGKDLGLRYREQSIVLFPRDMLVKRAEQGEEIDVHYLFEQVCSVVRTMIDSGEYP